MISFAVVLLLLLAPAAGIGSLEAQTADPVRADGAIAAEWLVRDRAARLDESLDSIAVDLRSDEWRVRHAAVEVLARTRGGSAERARDMVLAALRDAHPNVRARAVDAAGMRRIDAGAEAWEWLASDRLPATRRALVRTLALVRPADAASRLAELAQDDDPQVAEEAFLALLALGDAGAQVSAAEWRRRDLGADGAALLEATEALARGPRAQQLFLELEAGATPAELALLAAAEARVGGTPDPRALLAGWFAPFPDDEALSIMRRRAQLLTGAEALGQAVLPHLIRDLQALDRWLADEPADFTSRRPTFAQRLQSGELGATACRDEWTEAALGAARGSGAALLELMESLSDDGFSAFADLAYGRLDSLEPPRVRGTGYSGRRQRAAERFAMTELAGEVYVRTHDPGAGQWLVLALEDVYEPCRRAAAYSLSSVADLRTHQQALYRVWLRLSPESALDWLTRFSRRYPLQSFRSDWISLWENEATEVSILELLSAFEGDEELIGRMETWMRRELRWLEQAAAGEQPARRASEGLAKACLEALVRLGADEEIFFEALERAEPLSEEIAKYAAAQLGKSAAGRALLLPWLAPAHAQRLRLEAALALAPTGNSAAVEVLVAGYETCDEELQVRSLRALGASGSEAGWTLPARVAADRLAGAGARLVAFEVLGGARPVERSARALIELAAGERDLEGRRLALRALGITGSPAALDGLAQLAGDGLDHESLREEWLLAAARCAGEDPPSWWFEAWGERPRDRAADDLRARFRGERLAAVEFTYRSELEAASLQPAFATELLAASGEWWRGDARWLGELSTLWRQTAEVEARRVARAAQIALHGEAPADDLGLARAKLTLRVAEAARAAGRFDDAADCAEELLLDWRLGRLRPRDWERALGTVDRSESRDPRARIEVFARDSRARAALGRGELDVARAWLSRAEAECGESAAARRECVQLARAIEDADQ